MGDGLDYPGLPCTSGNSRFKCGRPETLPNGGGLA